MTNFMFCLYGLSSLPINRKLPIWRRGGRTMISLRYGF